MAQVIYNEQSGDTALILTEDEAATLHTLLWCHIAGPDEGPRGVLTNIAGAINEAGVPQRDKFRLSFSDRDPDHRAVQVE